jgi:hypothetical protein
MCAAEVGLREGNQWSGYSQLDMRAIERGASISLSPVVTDLRAFGCATDEENPAYRRSPSTVGSISPVSRV